jgi:hypothetical protein
MHRIWPGHKRRPKFGGTELIHGFIDPVERAWRARSPITYGDTWTINYDDLMDAIRPVTS